MTLIDEHNLKMDELVAIHLFYKKFKKNCEELIDNFKELVNKEEKN
jgi:hypothetical protein